MTKPSQETRLPDLIAKLEALRTNIRGMGAALVAFSGGVDSTFLAGVAQEELGEKAVAATARSETYPEREFREAADLAQRIGIRHEVVETSELALDAFRTNPPDRCYHCKTELYLQLHDLRERLNVAVILNGANADDMHDYRPGTRAAVEQSVCSPLAECGLSKRHVRELARHWGLPIWDKPATPCLSSRIAYGESVTVERLAGVVAAAAAGKLQCVIAKEWPCPT